MTDWLTYILTMLVAAASAASSLKFIHMLQLESYQGKMYLKWLKAHLSDCLPYLSIGLLSCGIRLLSAALNNHVLETLLYRASDLICIASLSVAFIVWLKKDHRKPLKYTARAIRLIVMLSIFCAALSCASLLDMGYTNVTASYIVKSVLRFSPCILAPIMVLLAYLITYPIEWLVKRWYFNDARRKLAARTDIVKIGITGSYGKTSTKFMLASMLSEKYNVLYTPSSYNTPMGITKIVRGELKPEHQVFVAEMGARYKGDIKELCELVRPTYGIITAVGKQHLETFGSFESVISTKEELLDSLPMDGHAFINGNSPVCVEMFGRCKVGDKNLFGIDGKGLYMHAENIEVGESGSSFDLVSADGRRERCTTALLGRHNILNIAGAASAAYNLGVSMKQISNAIASLEPVEHRLQLIKGAVTVIDDAFNSNPAGAKAALEVLSAFSGRRIIVTPGMVELGNEEAALNEEFGRQIAECADIAIIVGAINGENIRRGLLSAGFDEKSIVMATTFSEATAALPSYTEPGCVVLFENDLTDNYN